MSKRARDKQAGKRQGDGCYGGEHHRVGERDDGTN